MVASIAVKPCADEGPFDLIQHGRYPHARVEDTTEISPGEEV